MTKEIEVEAIEDIRNFSGALIAKKGRKGIIWGYEADYVDRFGLGQEVKEHRYFYVQFEGNKINREVLNKSIKRLEK
jgi:hypothetical protein